MKQKFARKIAFTLSAMASIGFALPAFAEKAVEVIIDSTPYKGSVPKNVKVAEIYSNNPTKTTNVSTSFIQKNVDNIDSSSISKASLTIVTKFSSDVKGMKNAIQAQKTDNNMVSDVELLGAFITDENGNSKLKIIKDSEMAKIAEAIRSSAVKAQKKSSFSGVGALSQSDESKAIANGWN